MTFCYDHHVSNVLDVCDRLVMRGMLNLSKRIGAFQSSLASLVILMCAALLVMRFPCVPTSWASEDALTSAVAVITTLPLRAIRRYLMS